MSTSSSPSPEPGAPSPTPITVAVPALAGIRRGLVVVAHPDDESFGLGAILAALVGSGIELRLLCFSAGEASTVGAARDLATRRRGELVAAAHVLGLAAIRMKGMPDGRLAGVPQERLRRLIESELESAELLVAFERAGVTRHPDHVAVTAAALAVAAARGLMFLEWGVPGEVADGLRRELGADFDAMDARPPLPVVIAVDRSLQLRAIACHRSQDPDNPVLRTRLRLLGPREWLKVTAPAASRVQGVGLSA